MDSGTTISGGSAPFSVDTLVVNFDLDLTGIGNDRIGNIERVDLTSGESNTLTLNADDVLAATDARNTLVVLGDSAADTGGAPDAANLVGDWTVAGSAGGFTDYVLGGATVSIEADVAVATVGAMAQIIGTPRNDNLVGTSVTNSPTGEDDIFGLAGADRIDGRSGNDRLFGGPGNDQLLGNVGDDLLFGEDDDDLLRGGSGDDQLFGGNGRDVLLGDDGDDLLAGDGGDDDLLGGSGDDLLEGGDGDDNLFGDAGDDVLDGGPGNNRLSGDADADRFLLADFDVDEILDLNLADGDVVDFSALAEEALSAGLLLGDAVRLEAGPSGTTLLVDVGDSNGFQDVALLRGVEPVVEVISPGELVALARPVAIPLVSLSLAALDGTNGFRLDGIDAYDYSGFSVSGAGDVNGDGFADLIVGAPRRSGGERCR